MATKCSQNKLFDEYLKTFSAPKGTSESLTHTRIGDQKLNIYGGAYLIPDEKQSEFFKKYYEHVFLKGNHEFLTEKQLIEEGPILIDIDMHYNANIETRQHTKDDIIDFVAEYANLIKDLVDVPDGTRIPVFVMEKPTVNMLDTITKDGIHIIFGLKMHKAGQTILRENMIKLFRSGTIWSHLHFENSWDLVLDEGIVKGFTNWQLYGSRKPGHKSYMLTNYFTLEYGESEDEWSIELNEPSNLRLPEELELLSARYKKHIQLDIRESCIEQFEEAKKFLTKKKKSENATGGNNRNYKIKINPIISKSLAYNDINSMEKLDAAIDSQFADIRSIDYELKETHNFTMILPEGYYGPGSYTKWIRVGWALKNTSEKLFLTFLKFSSQPNCRRSLRDPDTDSFDWNRIDELVEIWNSFDSANPDGLTKRSIMYWAKQESLSKYNEVRKETIDFFIDETLHQATEYDLATVLFNIFKDKFVCISIKNNMWYEYRNHRWFEIDSGNTLRSMISKEMHDIYSNKIRETINMMHTLDRDDEKWKNLQNLSNKMSDICMYLKKTQWKNNIMREARELFYDMEFMKKLDTNPHLLCFNNGVVDFKTRIFRKGQPDDYLSKCTLIDYTHKRDANFVKEINDFMSQLFPSNELRKYMWDFLASCLIGTNENQTFNIWTGTGANGKSILVELMTRCLGEYKGTVPLPLITKERINIGNASPELAQLIGIRLGVMSEPSKNNVINEGPMKELTGGDPLQARALYKDSVTFIPQFKLVVCTNTLFDIKSNDDGTWRRIRVCPFESKFLMEPYADPRYPESEYPYQFKMDKKLSAKFDAWAPTLMSLLVELAFERQGIVNDCEKVMAQSDKYREGQDYLLEFIKECIEKKEGGKIRKKELSSEFKKWYQENFSDKKVPNIKELAEFMDKRFGRAVRTRDGAYWDNVSIIYGAEESNPMVELN